MPSTVPKFSNAHEWLSDKHAGVPLLPKAARSIDVCVASVPQDLAEVASHTSPLYATKSGFSQSSTASMVPIVEFTVLDVKCMSVICASVRVSSACECVRARMCV